ncbi:META domain-containing protein [Inhella sp.]|uniref:META domain-containing protein n=1 Tax=Inhella sp. TaxID=1921806 RepID=UPI0035AF162C
MFPRSAAALAACVLAAACSSSSQRAIEPARPVAAVAAQSPVAPHAHLAPLTPLTPRPAASATAVQLAPPRFEAQGHQPRWSLRLQGQDEIVFEAEDGLRFRTQTLFTPDTSPGAAALGIEVQGHPALLSAERRLCRDARSAQPHPWQVSVTYRGKVYLGCGGRPATLLEGAAWQADALDGAPSLSPRLSSLQFEPDGRVSGRTPCNRFSARFDTRDGGLSLSAPASTRMACQEPARQAEEAALLAFLPQVARFDFEPGGDLLLRAADGRRLRLSRAAR